MLSVLVSVMEMANRRFIRSSNKPGLANNLFQFMEPHIMVSSRAPWTISIIFLVIPLIHVKDLASVVLHVLDSKPKTRYILAVDQG